MAPPTDPIILYLYTFSPYGRKVTEYLALRNIPHIEVHQAPVPPRADLQAIGVSYRRIPVMAIGRDVYCDSALILSKLEQLYPASPGRPILGATNGPDRALENLLEKWTTDIAFLKTLYTIPHDFPAMQDAAFTKDRGGIWGGDWGPERQQQLRPQGLVEVGEMFSYLEDLVGDGRKFVLRTDQPTLADVHALWVFHWLLELVPGSLPEDFADKYPKAYAWRSRYFDAVKAGKAATPETSVIEGADATKKLTSAGFADTANSVDSMDPVAQKLGLKSGSKIEVYPSDIGGGEKSKEVGELVALSSQEVVIKKVTQDGSAEVRVHTPRFNYKILLAGS